MLDAGDDADMEEVVWVAEVLAEPQERGVHAGFNPLNYHLLVP